MIRPIMHACRYIPFVGAVPGGILLADHLIKDRQHSIHLIAKACLYDKKPKHPVRDALLYITPFVNTLFGLCQLIAGVARRIFPQKTPPQPASLPPPSRPPLVELSTTPSVELPKPLSAEDIEAAKEKALSAQDALAIARYYLNEKNEVLAIEWLCKAKNYTKDALPIDLADFFSHITAIHTPDLFAHEELYLAAAKSPTISALKLVNIAWDHSMAFCVAHFLRKTTSITTLHLEHAKIARNSLSAQNVSSLIGALQVNTSIKHLILREPIIDGGVVDLLAAIEANSALSLETVILDCWMRDPSAEKLLELLKKGKIKAATAKIDSTNYALIDEIAKYAPKSDEL